MKIRAQEFSNGLCLEFYDRTNRYFGDYNRVVIEVQIRCPVARSFNPDDPVFKKAIDLLGETAVVTKTIERMGVATADVALVRDQMIDGFILHASAYLGRSDYPASLIRAELDKSRSVHRLYPPKP